MNNRKIKIEEYGAGHFNLSLGAHGVGELDLAPPLNTPDTLRLIAAAITREADRIERAGAPLVKREGTNGVQVDGWWV